LSCGLKKVIAEILKNHLGSDAGYVGSWIAKEIQ
jgi:hypothetical protein